MKKLFVFAIAATLLSSCTKDDDNNPSSNNGGNGNGNGNGNGSGNVVPGAVGQWLHGTFAMADYWAYDGTYLGNPFTQSVAFDFKSDGTYEMFYAAEANNYGCSSAGFSYFKGYVVFNENSFIVHPQQGTFRGYYNCTPQYDFNRPAASYELNVDTFYYNFETMNDKDWMVVRFNPTDSFPSYFEKTEW